MHKNAHITRGNPFICHLQHQCSSLDSITIHCQYRRRPLYTVCRMHRKQCHLWNHHHCQKNWIAVTSPKEGKGIQICIPKAWASHCLTASSLIKMSLALNFPTPHRNELDRAAHYSWCHGEHSATSQGLMVHAPLIPSALVGHLQYQVCVEFCSWNQYLNKNMTLVLLSWQCFMAPKYYNNGNLNEITLLSLGLWDSLTS